TAYTVDQVNRDTAVVHNLTSGAKSFNYGYNAVNDITAVDRNQCATDENADAFSYDLTQQIVEFRRDGTLSGGVVTGGTDNTMNFDGCGNRTKLNNTNYTFNSMNQESDVPHDNEGNVQSYNGFTYTYDAQNRLRQASSATLT